MSLIEALPIALLGALLGLDVVSFPQAMISRPIVAATLAGAFIGHPAAGLLIGVVLELIALDTLPFGASRYPEWGSAGVVGGAVIAGAIIASRPPGYVVYPGYAQPAYGTGCYWASQPVYDGLGRVVGYTGRPVQVCPGYVPPPPPAPGYAGPPPAPPPAVQLPPK